MNGDAYIQNNSVEVSKEAVTVNEYIEVQPEVRLCVVAIVTTLATVLQLSVDKASLYKA